MRLILTVFMLVMPAIALCSGSSGSKRKVVHSFYQMREVEPYEGFLAKQFNAETMLTQEYSANEGAVTAAFAKEFSRVSLLHKHQTEEQAYQITWNNIFTKPAVASAYSKAAQAKALMSILEMQKAQQAQLAALQKQVEELEQKKKHETTAASKK